MNEFVSEIGAFFIGVDGMLSRMALAFARSCSASMESSSPRTLTDDLQRLSLIRDESRKAFDSAMRYRNIKLTNVMFAVIKIL